MKPRAAALPVLLVAAWLALASPAAAADRAAALAAKHAGDHPRAIALFRELVAAHPGDADLRFQLGTVLGWAGDYPAALTELEAGLAVAPQNTDLRLARGRVLAWSGQHARAEEVFRAILAEQPASLEAQNMLGRVLAWRRQFDAAETVFDNILVSAPSDPDALVGRGDVERAQERFDTARDYYRRARAADPGAAEIEQRLASVRRAGRWRLDAGYEVSTFSPGTRDDWTGWDASLRYALDKRTGVALSVEQAERFGTHDTQYGGALDRRFSDALSVAARLTATPEADFFADHMIALGGVWRVREGSERLAATRLTADYRAAAYAPGTAHSLWAGVSQVLTGRLTASARVLFSRNLNARWTEGWQVRLDGEPADHWRWYLGYADSRESLSSTVFDFTRELRTRAVFGGVYYEFSPSLGLRLDLTEERTDTLPDRRAIHAGCTTRF